MMQSTIRFTRRIMTLLLAVVMLFGTLMTTADAADRTNVRHYDTYMCIGDSIAAGFYIDGQRAGYYRTRMPGAYHDIIANATDAKLNQFGWSAFRAVELRYMLEGVRYDLDDVWLNSFRPLVNDQLLDQNREDYLKAIRESDLITVNLGSNDVLSYTMSKTVMQLQSSSDCELAAKVKEIAGKCGDIGTAFVKVLGYAEKAGKKAVSYFKDNFTACMRGIYKLNPSATVVVVGVYNPMSNVTLVENGNLKLAPLVQPAVDLLNQFLKSGCLYSDWYRFAPVPKTETWKIHVLGGDFTSQVITKVHPTANGHSYMADQILSVLPTSDGSTSSRWTPFGWLRSIFG